jgi:hypothetical protein
MTCGDPITVERLHELTMAASYWMQQYQKLEKKMLACGNVTDLETLQHLIKEGGTLH